MKISKKIFKNISQSVDKLNVEVYIILSLTFFDLCQTS